MRITGCIFSAIIAIALIYMLNIQHTVNSSKTPIPGFFLSPQTGFWQSAEPVNDIYDCNLKFSQLKGRTQVYFDDRLVPHVYAQNENDAWFVQGYLHAKFRLWQMDFQTYAAGGRLSEIMGDSSNGTNFLKIDKFFRRLGMVYAAEKMLHVMENDAPLKAACDAYTAGVNAYINSLSEKDYPLEYKLLNYKPEPWTNMKSALFIKYMAYDLAGYEQDFEKTNAKAFLSREQYEKMFPYVDDSIQPIITNALPKLKNLFSVKTPANVDSVYFNYQNVVAPAETPVKPNKENGSNNWAVAGSKTKSGRPILCNDPHLGLNLPSLWFEMQISTPGFNCYGATLPGAPNILIGFNDNCAWGLTNAERDVRDYYEVRFKDESVRQYWFNGEWRDAQMRDEVIKIRNKPSDTEHIAITVFGPVMYDPHYPDKLNSNKYYACRWKAHDESNELGAVFKLAHAKNYNDYLNAITTFSCPSQNFVFADKAGDVAIKQQGVFPALWYRQGDFLMPGIDSSYMWQDNISDSLQQVMHNPERGFVSSANQWPYDPKIYPYYMNGYFNLYRSWLINRSLSSMQNITADDMKQLQTSVYNIVAEKGLPVLMPYLNISALTTNESRYLTLLENWNMQNDAASKAATVFKLWVDSCIAKIYGDELHQSNLPVPKVEPYAMFRNITRDTAKQFADNINTNKKETLNDDVTNAFKSIIPILDSASKAGSLEWGKFKDGMIAHLLKIPSFSHLHVDAGGGSNIINAFGKDHGPSWRMIVELTDKINAYGVYPGGQSGNPGSKHYDDFIDTWTKGKYYKIQLYNQSEIATQKNNLGKMSFSN